MSKSAIAALTKAAHIAKYPVAALTHFITDKNFRKEGKWRNADALAVLIIDSIKNAYLNESCVMHPGFHDAVRKHGFRDMHHAIETYVESNMDTWQGDEWLETNLKMALEVLQRVIDSCGLEAAHSEALAFNAVLDRFPKHWAEHDIIKYWCKYETSEVTDFDATGKAVL